LGVQFAEAGENTMARQSLLIVDFVSRRFHPLPSNIVRFADLSIEKAPKTVSNWTVPEARTVAGLK